MFFGPITYYGGKPPKGRVAKIVHPQEKLIFATHFHFLTIAKYWIPCAVSSLLTLIIPPFLPLSYAVNAGAILVAITLIAAAYGLGSTYLWSREWFVVTNRRVLLIKGIIVRKVPQMPATKVTDMTYERSVAGLIFGYGTFIFESAGQVQALSKITFVPNPDELHHELATVVYDLKGKKISGMKPLPRFGGQFRKLWHWVAGRPVYEDLEEAYDPAKHDDLEVAAEPADPSDLLDQPLDEQAATAARNSPADQQSARSRQPASSHQTAELPTKPLGIDADGPVLAPATTRTDQHGPQHKDSTQHAGSTQPKNKTPRQPGGRQPGGNNSRGRARAAAQQQRDQLRRGSDQPRPVDPAGSRTPPAATEAIPRQNRRTSSATTASAPKPTSSRRPPSHSIPAAKHPQPNTTKKHKPKVTAQDRKPKATAQERKKALAHQQVSELLEEWGDD